MAIVIDISSKTSLGSLKYISFLLKNFNNKKYGFNKIIVWCSEEFKNKLPIQKNIIYKTNFLLNNGPFFQFIWFFIKDFYLQKECEVLFSPYGNYLGFIKPYVVVSQNMLYFEDYERRRFGFTITRLKLKISSIIQKISFKRASGIIFLSKYASLKIKKSVKINNIRSRIISFGIEKKFYSNVKIQKEISGYSPKNRFVFLYISTVFPYKNHINLIKAFNNLIIKGYPISINLIGGGDSLLIEKIKNLIISLEKSKNHINYLGNKSPRNIEKYYHKSDAFVFPSSCENLPNILIEAMKSGLPISSSSLPPMNQILKKNAFYFNPYSIIEIERAIIQLMHNPKKRSNFAINNQKFADNLTWEKCANKTFLFLKELTFED